jgi:hypothetical protein
LNRLSEILDAISETLTVSVVHCCLLVTGVRIVAQMVTECKPIFTESSQNLG